MRFTIYIFITMIIGACQLHAQSRKITLHEAIELGVANSKQLQLSQSKVEEAQARVSQARDKAWPEVKASATYLKINTPNVSVSGSDNNGGSGSGSSPFAAFSKLHTIGLGQLTVSEPIFAGFRIRNNKLMQQYLEEAARYDVTTTRNKVVTNTARAIYQYYELLETQKVVEQNMKKAQQRVAEFKNLEAQSLLAKNDRLKAELQAHDVELTQTEINNDVALAQFNLAILLGLPDDTQLALDTTGMFQNAPAATWEEYLQKGLENRTELKAAQLQQQANDVNYKIAKSNRYPTLALSGGYVAVYIPNVLTVTNALNGGLALQYNITGAIHGKHIMQEARARQHQAELSKMQATDEVRVDIKRKFLNYQKSQDKIAITSLAIDQAKENYTIAQNKYNAGLMILSDYLDADVTLLQAQINHASARAESMIAYYELQESIGNNQ